MGQQDGTRPQQNRGSQCRTNQEWDECRNSWDHQPAFSLGTSWEGPSSCCKREEHSPTQLLGPPPAFIQKGTAGMWLWVQEGSAAPQFLPVPTRRACQAPLPHRHPSGLHLAQIGTHSSCAPSPLPVGHNSSVVPGLLTPTPHCTQLQQHAHSSVPLSPRMPSSTSLQLRLLILPSGSFSPAATSADGARECLAPGYASTQAKHESRRLLPASVLLPSTVTPRGSAPHVPTLDRSAIDSSSRGRSEARGRAEATCVVCHICKGSTAQCENYWALQFQNHLLPLSPPRAQLQHQTKGRDHKIWGFTARRGVWSCKCWQSTEQHTSDRLGYKQQRSASTGLVPRQCLLCSPSRLFVRVSRTQRG